MRWTRSSGEARRERMSSLLVGPPWLSPTTLDGRRATVEVDAVFVPTSEVRRAARRVAERLGLAEDWLNDGAKAFVPGADPDRREVFEGQHLQVAAASPRFLLAMKLLASRVERDQDDIRTLYQLCDFTTAEEGLRLVESTYPGYLLAPRTRFMLEEMFPDRRREHGHEGPALGI